MRLDPPAVDVGAVERAEIVDVVAVLAVDDERMVARDGDVIEEHGRIGGAADAHSVLVDREALARAAAAGADHERRARPVHRLLEIDGLVLAGLVDAVAHRRRLLLGALRSTEIGAALLAVVRALGVDEAALRTVDRRHPRAPSGPR